MLYGAKISRGVKIKKKEKIEFLAKDALFAGLGGEALFQEEHSERITLPRGFALLTVYKCYDM